MKRISMSLSALICLIMSLSAVLPVSADTIRYMRGDANGDGVVNINDATKIQGYLAEFDDPYSIGRIIAFDEYELPFIPNN